MIIEYHRPSNLDQALTLLERKTPITIPLAGGNVVSRSSESPVAVIDLQSLALDGIEINKYSLKIGAMTRLQEVVESPLIPTGLKKAAQRETNINVRRTATIGGVLVTSDGTSPLLGCLLVLDAKLFWEPGGKSLFLSEWLVNERSKSPGKLITGLEITIPVEADFDDIARSPEDKPQVFVTTARWNTGEIRVVFGGCGKAPMLGSDGSKNLVSDIFNRYSYAAALERNGYSEYQQSAIMTLIERLVPKTGIFGGKGLL
jgi:CO/xanthine dehydrogenase FAD-binding subunit